MLDTIPPEILAHISYHLSTPTLSPPVALLCTSKHFAQHLSPANNPNLYATLYKDNFDISAPARRLGGKVGNEGLAAELESRVRALRRLGRSEMEDGKAEGAEGAEGAGGAQVEDRDVWVLYLLIVEHDRKNLDHLFSDTFNILDFLKRYSDDTLLSAAAQSGYPSESVGRSLIMWIAWIMYTYGIGCEETLNEKAKRLFILRPYVFAAHKYSAYYGPWTNHNLPISSSSSATPGSTSASIRDDPLQGHPFLADLIPKSRGVEIGYYGRKITISPPLLAHAAILRFFKRHNPDDDFDDEEGEEDEFDDDEIDVDRVMNFVAEAGGRPIISPTTLALDMEPTSTPPQQNPRLTRLARKYRKGPLSQIHDRDWARLIKCYDASSSPGMRVKDWRNAFSGCWEGNFSFFEFEAFSEMVTGNTRALYEGPFGQQAQVWKITETFVWPQKDRTSTAVLTTPRTDAPNEDETSSNRGRKGKGKEPAPTPSPVGLPLHGPATNAGYPINLPAPSPAGLATPSAEQTTLADTIRHQVEAIEGYEIVPDSELDEAIERGEEGLEVLLTGTGHSAWGRFILKGRVRIFDGMCSLVKEYAPDARGKWIYRGYVVAGDVMVGRWRDTYTPEKFIGYEGTFTLSRRE